MSSPSGDSAPLLPDPVDKYGIELLRFLDPRLLDPLLGWASELEPGLGLEAPLGNETLAGALAGASEVARERLLGRLTRVRREAVAARLGTAVGASEGWRMRCRERLLGALRKVVAAEPEEALWDAERHADRECPPWLAVEEAPPVPPAAAVCIAPEEFPERFDLFAEPDLVAVAQRLADLYRRHGKHGLDAVRERFDDPYSRDLFRLLLDDTDDGWLSCAGEAYGRALLEEYGRGLALTRLALVGLAYGRPLPALARELALLLPGPGGAPEASLAVAVALERPDPAVAEGLVERFVHLLALARVATEEGVLGLEPYAEAAGEPLLKLGLDCLLDGYEAADLEALLLSRQESLMAEVRRRMELFLDLCLGLRCCPHPRILGRRAAARLGLPEPR